MFTCGVPEDGQTGGIQAGFYAQDIERACPGSGAWGNLVGTAELEGRDQASNEKKRWTTLGSPRCFGNGLQGLPQDLGRPTKEVLPGSFPSS